MSELNVEHINQGGFYEIRRQKNCNDRNQWL